MTGLAKLSEIHINSICTALQDNDIAPITILLLLSCMYSLELSELLYDVEITLVWTVNVL